MFKLVIIHKAELELNIEISIKRENKILFKAKKILADLYSPKFYKSKLKIFPNVMKSFKSFALKNAPIKFLVGLLIALLIFLKILLK